MSLIADPGEIQSPEHPFPVPVVNILVDDRSTVRIPVYGQSIPRRLAVAWVYAQTYKIGAIKHTDQDLRLGATYNLESSSTGGMHTLHFDIIGAFVKGQVAFVPFGGTWRARIIRTGLSNVMRGELLEFNDKEIKLTGVREAALWYHSVLCVQAEEQRQEGYRKSRKRSEAQQISAPQHKPNVFCLGACFRVVEAGRSDFFFGNIIEYSSSEVGTPEKMKILDITPELVVFSISSAPV
ncbi:hypothetical protein BDV96DRAFT_638587 [Lophiotrema nucula]|uniref:Uncharacterized protein n=1 Tax=Lophiotrema nucula TaxID=690887 RepID=A0A6A5YFV7_9PLEO|nr:hypothetical protein BDV96DRAFT_638587 [Lophiotrema nucula]